MQISAINPRLGYNKPIKNNTFKAHPDFNKLAKKYDIKASSYFRRGPFYGSSDSGFNDIIKVFKEFFSKDLISPIKMLIVGIGDSQEPFSYLAAIKKIIGDKNLKDVLDLHIVDLQSKPNKEQLFKDSYYEFSHEPDFVASSFIYDRKENMKYDILDGYYRVNDEIFNFLHSTYKDKTKSFWEARVQDVSKELKSQEYDIISANNILGYIKDKDERIGTTKNFYRILKENGVYITDTFYNNVKEANLQNKYGLIDIGIYKKL